MSAAIDRMMPWELREEVARLRSLLADAEAKARHYGAALEWIEHNAVGNIALACADEPHHAHDGLRLVARALSETA